MQSRARSILAASAIVGVIGISATGAAAETQVLTGTVGGTIAIDMSGAPATSIALPTAGVSESIGSVVVNSNTAYTLSVKSDVATMTQYDTSYSTNAEETLDAPMSLLPSLTDGTATLDGTVSAPIVVSTTDQTVGFNALSGLLSEADTYALGVNQPVTALDPTGNYRMVLTYTASSGIPTP